MPSILPIDEPKSALEGFILNLGMVGYIDTSSASMKEPRFKSGMIANLSGDLIIKNRNVVEQVVGLGEVSVILPVQIDGQLFAMFDYSLSDRLIDIIKTSDCYVKSSGFDEYRL